MTVQILMPQLSPTMEEGKLAKWHVKQGDRVRSGDVVAEIETDKATMEVEAPEDGVIEKLLLAEGTERVPVNHAIALLSSEDDIERPSAAMGSSSPLRGEEAPKPSFGAGEGHHRAIESKAASPRPFPQGGEGVQATEQVMHRIAEQIRGNGGNGHGARIYASPLARRLARETGIELASLDGSGPHGRIVKADVERAARLAIRPADVAEAPFAEVEPVQAEETPKARAQELIARRETQEPSGMTDSQVLALYRPDSYEIVPHDTMRRFIAERLTLSKQTIPHFYLAIDCELDALMAARARLNELAPKEGPRAFKLSVNDFIIKALAMALQTAPAANATWTERGILRHRASDISVAVALEGGGLHTPVIRDAEVKSLSEISNEMRDLAARARSKRLAPHQYQGGSTTISNLGMYGIDRFDAVINPPQASIMAVGRAEKRAIVKNDALKIATMMSVTLSVDHRVIDGALGAELLAAFKAFIEDPVTMLV
ncbi:MAG TPA: pyruvate dehydrogenase complex dihydrolipoamide acetyltransferase [Methyloceanibacter sp.]|jgi:pyruvate dehydrogenase E2 component (dihydrolipoamide acetyltransferase)|nr:pyruvate dehydrogenase complex dihydrolipoamide acetyltransferase [Methyloceanibacter sp.]